MNTGKTKYDLETPCLILDIDILERNMKTMQVMADKKGKKLRPHAKTHKCSIITKKQIEAGAIGICAAKVSEAEALAKAGLNGILLTGPAVTPSKITRIIEILAISPSFIVTADNAYTVDLLNAALKEKNLSIDILIDIDAGLKRTGVKISDVIEFAQYVLTKENLHLRGIQAYAGHIQHIVSYDERKITSYKCFEDIIPIFNKLHSEIENFTIFSASGTGTFEIDSEIPEITEHQVGSYIVMDAEYLAIESSDKNNRFTLFDPALKLLTTVISTNQQGFVTVDAGLKTLYKDGAIPQILTPEFQTMKYDWFGDEYGKIIYNKNSRPPAIGTLLELVVSHCDPTINLFDRFYIIKDEKVIDVWSIDLRGLSQ